MNWSLIWAVAWRVGMTAAVIGGFTLLISTSIDNSAAKVARIAAYPQMYEGLRVATGPQTEIRIREFDYKDKRCIWVTSSGHGTGITCWDRKP